MNEKIEMTKKESDSLNRCANFMFEMIKKYGAEVTAEQEERNPLNVENY